MAGFERTAIRRRRVEQTPRRRLLRRARRCLRSGCLRLGGHERARRVEYLLAVTAPHETVVQRELLPLQSEDGFTMRAARREEHGQPGSQRGLSEGQRLF
ncbi:hypothetical protein Y026_2990 [Burkholderia pseudomallei TSV28]|nr:hypothetical protein Y025_2924 [Burkholderia pseudomallei TSV32]KGX71193.1 hypothetical protein Y026_2990 [Burkholderia pseudomallei TSV28]